MTTIALLLVSNTFMTFAWYGHLKYKSTPILVAFAYFYGRIAQTGPRLTFR